ncbi:5'/3'-nucleotidase SurE [Butyrivibrio sp. CB08]|uniref:5'/3'-nucleotidase SurE n=1 Tax=Butyrivibrio sp. CB08 TaxID=2364879 RepID=UPI000EA972B9|nr:5'/3'-nucleotidase SurE [Butyrivibrio sp. CB08]RKM58747.1 5'/3'-nucleotidase SurE [Butyrivibrio sp. CB08]
MKKILITNDDGIHADGIVRLSRVAQEFGEVWVVAPDSERSAMSHSLTLRRRVEVWETDFPVPGVKAFACDGKPADCVRIGALNIIPGGPDCVMTGINYGYNVAADLQYSATAGAALEASFQKIHAIAFSESNNGIHEVTDKHIRDIMAELIDAPLDEWQIWNVNFPGCSLEECKGILRGVRVSRDGFYEDRYSEEVVSEGRKSYMVDGIRKWEAAAGTDLWAMINNYVSIGVVNNLS